jgi:signal transduction histidine kinase
MNRMLDRLDDSQRTQRRFISDASHELKSPLASLRQYAEVARSYPDRMTAAELTEAIDDEGGRLERIVRGMLVLARADEGSLRKATRPVDLDDLLLQEAQRLKASTALTVDAAIEPARIEGDPELLAQVVRNLVVYYAVVLVAGMGIDKVADPAGGGVEFSAGALADERQVGG